MKHTLILAVLGVLFFFGANSFAQEKGNINGKVTDINSNDPLPGATIVISELNFGTTSDRFGNFRLNSVPVGSYTIAVSYLGYTAESQKVEVKAGTNRVVNFSIKPGFVETDEVVIEGLRQGQTLALNIQKTADNIKNVIASDLIGRFPDPNVAEALQRVPGISVQRDQGEGRYIQIRGTNPNLSNISINGEQIPSPEGDIRYVALDMIPSDMLSMIEVTKAITPDMDGDAIGGSVNLNTLSLLEDKPFLKTTVTGEYNSLTRDLSPLGGLGSVTLGQRFGEKKQLGFLVGASYNRTNRASDNNEMAYDDGELEELQLRDYELTRERLGVTSALDFKFSPSSKIYFNGMYNYFSDQEYRRRLIVEKDKLERELKDRLEKQTIYSLSGGGEHDLSSLFHVDYMLSYSYADQNTPYDRAISFEQEVKVNKKAISIIDFNTADPDYPQFTTNADGVAAGAGAYNYDKYKFNELESSSELTTDKHFTSRLNLKSYFNFSDIYGELKFGGLYRSKEKQRDPSLNYYDYDGDLLYSQVQGDFRDEDYLSKKYGQGVGFMPDPKKVEDFFSANRAKFELVIDDSKADTEAERYSAKEKTYAGYAQTKLQFGNFSTILGARYEQIDMSYVANVVEYDASGDLMPIKSTSSSKDFGFFLPMIHVKYSLSPKTNLRFAWTNSYAKPNYFDLAPYRIVNREDEEIEFGNPDLEPTKSMNFDLMGEYYFSSVGVISAGVFMKSIKDFIYTRSYIATAADIKDYVATQPVNGDDADLMGFELNLQQQLSFLPGFWSGFGIYANYTYSWSEAEIFSEEKATTPRKITLPGQTEHVGNFALSYENYGFSGRVSLHYAGAFIDEVRDKSKNDRWYDARMQLDVSLSQRITPQFQIFLEAINLTDAPLRYYNGVTGRPEQQEFYSWWTKLGVKFEM